MGKGRQHMSTDTDLDPKIFGGHLVGYVTATWDELRRLFGPESKYLDTYKTYCGWDVIFQDGTTCCIYDWKLSEPLAMHDSYDWHIGGTDARAVQYVDATLLAFRKRPKAVATSPVTYVLGPVPRARTESRSDHALCETVNIRWVPLPLSDLAQVALNDLTLTGNAREWSTPYLQALTTHEEGQTHYGADTVESLIAYALSGMVPWRGESAETVKAMFESYLPACQREG